MSSELQIHHSDYRNSWRLDPINQMQKTKPKFPYINLDWEMNSDHEASQSSEEVSLLADKLNTED